MKFHIVLVAKLDKKLIGLIMLKGKLKELNKKRKMNVVFIGKKKKRRRKQSRRKDWRTRTS